MQRDNHILLCCFAGVVTYVLAILALCFIDYYSYPDCYLKYIDLQQGGILKLTNKKSADLTFQSFPDIRGEAHINLRNFVLKPKRRYR